jgi:uncharacterized protein
MTQSKIRKFSDQIAQRFLPEKIILFGSQANGNAHKDSDVDVLVVMDYDGPAPHKAAEILSSINPDFSCDLLVRKASEVQDRLMLNDYFFRELVTKGQVLYEARHA